MEKLLAKAIMIASAAFVNNLDRAGKPYILHCLWVMNAVRHLGTRAMILAVLHDLLEGTDWTVKQLSDEGFPIDICCDLVMLRHHPDETYEEYVAKMQHYPDVIEVKLRDLEHNSKITRLKGLRDKDIERMKKYHKAYLFLKECLKAKQ